LGRRGAFPASIVFTWRKTMEHPTLEWGHQLEVLRTLREWSREELAAAAGVSASTIAEQEQGEVTPSKGNREKIEEALGVAGREQELQMLAEVRADMLDPGWRYRNFSIEQAGLESKRMTELLLRVGLDEFRRIGPEDSPDPQTLGLEWPLLLRTLRTLRGWSQEELAAASGLTPSAISKQERDRRSPRPALREKVEVALRVRDRIWQIKVFLGLLRATMLSPVRSPLRPVVAEVVEEAGEKARRITEAALRVGLEDLRKMDDEEIRRWKPAEEEM
jgi:transcriptional regulator with XRE-family HTH domain